MQQILQLENANMLLFIVKNYIFLRGMYKHVFVFKIFQKKAGYTLLFDQTRYPAKSVSRVSLKRE